MTRFTGDGVGPAQTIARMHRWRDSYIDDARIETAFPVIIEIPKGSSNNYDLD